MAVQAGKALRREILPFKKMTPGICFCSVLHHGLGKSGGTLRIIVEMPGAFAAAPTRSWREPLRFE